MRFLLSSLIFFSYGLPIALPAVAQESDSTPFPQQTAAPETTFKVQYLGTVDGLPRNNVNALLEDRYGFLWIGTGNGLVRYDGYEFKSYYPVVGDSTTIGGRWINMLHEDRSGAIWIGGWGWGMSRYDRRSNRFTNYYHDPSDPSTLGHNYVRSVEASAEDPDEYWVAAHTTCHLAEAAGSFGRLNKSTGRFTPYALGPLDPENAMSKCFVTLLRDRNDAIWLGGWGLRRFNEETGEVQTFYPDPRFSIPRETDPPQNSVNLVLWIVESKSEQGILWVASTRGLHRFDSNTASFTTYFPFPEDPVSNRNYINRVYEDRNGIVWVGTFNEGLMTLDTRTGQFTRFPLRPLTRRIYAIAEDRFGVLWIGSEDGLTKLVQRQYPVEVHEHYEPDPNIANVRMIFTDRAGNLWTSRTNRLDRKNRVTGNVTSFIFDADDPGSLPKGNPVRMFEDRDGALWVAGACGVAAWGALGLLHPGSDTFTHYRHDPDDPQSLSEGCINGVLNDRSGRIWVYTWGGGFNLMNRDTGNFRRFSHQPDSTNSLVHDQILYMYEDREGLLWIGTEQGMSRFDPDAKAFTNYTDYRLNRVMMMHEDAKGRFWISTASNGLHLFDRALGQIVKSYSTGDGLVSDIVWSIYEDQRGYFWMSTNQGISRFNAESETFTNFSVRTGLPFDLFIEAGHHQSASGELFFGGLEGVFSFFPEDFDGDPVPPNIVLTDFRLAEQPVPIGPDEPLKAAIIATDAVTLAHNQNDVTFGYAGIHSIASMQNRHRYMLEGYDTDWVDAGVQRTARYSRLPPGEYTFRVKAVSSESVWSTEDATVQITILPPWWRTFPMFLVYGSLFFVAVYGVDRFQRRRLIAKEREKTRERELAQAKEIEKAYAQLKTTQQQLIQQEKMASLGQLTSGIAHEIKNPLNFVNNFAEINDDLVEELKKALEEGADVKEMLDMIRLNTKQIAKHGKRADRIVESMMQHAGGKSDRYEVALNPLVDEFVTVTYSSLKAQYPDLEIKIEKSLDEGVGSLIMAPQDIGRVLQNILSNAFEAVHAKASTHPDDYVPCVHIKTFRGENEVEIRISDNGVGIPQKARDKVFEPFFTTKPTGSGTGLGLSLSYDIVTQGHGGRLEFESAEGEGAAFVVSLPA